MSHAALLRTSKDDGTRWAALVEWLLPGAHVVLIGDSADWKQSSLRARMAGLSVRDVIAVLRSTETLFITLLRKDIQESSVAQQLLSTGTGAINIDASRVFTDWNEPDRPDSWKASGHSAKPDAEKIAAPPGTGIVCHPKGRWPTNLLLLHDVECLIGTCIASCPSQALEFQEAGASRFYTQLRSEGELMRYLRDLVLPEDGQIFTEFP